MLVFSLGRYFGLFLQIKPQITVKKNYTLYFHYIQFDL